MPYAGGVRVRGNLSQGVSIRSWGDVKMVSWLETQDVEARAGSVRTWDLSQHCTAQEPFERPKCQKSWRQLMYPVPVFNALSFNTWDLPTASSNRVGISHDWLCTGQVDFYNFSHTHRRTDHFLRISLLRDLATLKLMYVQLYVVITKSFYQAFPDSQFTSIYIVLHPALQIARLLDFEP